MYEATVPASAGEFRPDSGSPDPGVFRAALFDGAKSSRHRRLDALTSIRFFAALHVLIYHWGGMWPEAFRGQQWYQGIVATGYVGVSLFFVLSGFILAYNYCSAERPTLNVGRFYAARAARVYPVYLLGWLLDAPRVAYYFLAGTSAAMGVVKLLLAAVLSLLLIQDWLPQTAVCWNPPSWSLSAEVFFYLTFPLLARLAWRVPERGIVAFLAALWLLSLASPAVGYALTPARVEEGVWASFFSYHPLVRLPEFLFGIVLCKRFLHRRIPRPAAGTMRGAAVSWLCVASGLVFILLTLVNQAHIPQLFLHGGLLLPAFGLLICGLAVGAPGLTASLSFSPLVRLGEASYALYILHQPIQYWFVTGCDSLGIQLPGAVQFLLLLALAIAISLVTYRYLEEPARRRLRRGRVSIPRTSTEGTERPLRLAVYGYVNRDSGSGPASHYLVLREVLRRGHEVDLYAIANFIHPQDLAAFPNLAYLPVAVPWADHLLHEVLLKFPNRVGWAPAALFNRLRHWLYYRRIENIIRRRHAVQPYDALLVLDVVSPFRRIAGLPCVNCPPGSPLGELEALHSCRDAVLRYAGRSWYYGLVAYYRVRVALVRGLERRCEQLVCGSRWTAGCWERLGFPRSRIAVVPFSLNLERFHPGPSQPADPDAAVTLLHLGRLVPRKRLDVLINAFRLLVKERSGVKLLIIGRFSYAAGYRRLLEPGLAPPGVEYREGIPRDQVADLFRSIDVLVQPSENEDFGSAVMEAQGCGVPVVVGPTNGTAEYIGKRSFVFAAYTPESVRDALRAAVDAIRADRVALAEDSRRAAETHFRPEEVAGRLLAVLREAARLAAAHGR